MNKFRFTINVLAIAIFTFAFTSMAQAQATRTWVSGVGDDANPCSRTAPCKTFAGAISKTAVDGEIDALDPAGFGSVTITKSITIDGNGWGSILVSGTNGVLVNVTAAAGVNNMVQLRNLSINGIGTGFNGVRILSSLSNTSVYVENCVIFGFRASTGRGISDERTGSGNLFVQNTLIKNNAGVGIAAISVGAVKTTLNDVQLFVNSDGVVLSGASNFLSARNVVANKNTNFGFSAAAGSQMDIIDSQSSYNATGIDANGGATVIRASRSTVSRNTTNGLGFSGGLIQSYGNMEVSANVGNNGPFSAAGPVLQ